MSNMSHCRFQNTLQDLKDCWDNMDENGMSSDEFKARNRLLILCNRIANNYEDEINDLLCTPTAPSVKA